MKYNIHSFLYLFSKYIKNTSDVLGTGSTLNIVPERMPKRARGEELD